MEVSYMPTRQDVDRYRSLRATLVRLNDRIVKTIPKQVMDEIGDAIGIRRNGMLVFDSEDMASVLMDCCLYDWFQNGENVVQKYAENYPPKPGTDESHLLQACLRAKYGILVVRSAVPGAGLYCHDVLNDDDLFLMDLALSHSIPNGEAALATRTIPLGEYWITGGAGLPIQSKAALSALRGMDRERYQALEGPGGLALTIVRACLSAGAADSVTYKNPGERPRKPRSKIAPRIGRHR